MAAYPKAVKALHDSPDVATRRIAGGIIRELALWEVPVKDGQWQMHQLQDTAFAWPTHEPKYESYTGWTPFQVILDDHFQELIKAQAVVFGLLMNDIAKFEMNNQVTII